MASFRRSIPLLAVMIILASRSGATEKVAAQAASVRCGWFDNPTPGNASLWDSDGEWTVGVQGGHQATGDWPNFKPAEWIRRGPGSYGFGCACLKVTVDHEEKNILTILWSRAKPLAQCRRDPKLAGIERELR